MFQRLNFGRNIYIKVVCIHKVQSSPVNLHISRVPPNGLCKERNNSVTFEIWTLTEIQNGKVCISLRALFNKEWKFVGRQGKRNDNDGAKLIDYENNRLIIELRK